MTDEEIIQGHIGSIEGRLKIAESLILYFRGREQTFQQQSWDPGADFCSSLVRVTWDRLIESGIQPQEVILQGLSLQEAMEEAFRVYRERGGKCILSLNTKG